MELTVGLHRMLWLRGESVVCLEVKCGRGEENYSFTFKQSHDHTSKMLLVSLFPSGKSFNFIEHQISHLQK